MAGCKYLRNDPLQMTEFSEVLVISDKISVVFATFMVLVLYFHSFYFKVRIF